MNMQQKGASTPITTKPNIICRMPETRHPTFANSILRQLYSPNKIQTRNRNTKKNRLIYFVDRVVLSYQWWKYEYNKTTAQKSIVYNFLTNFICLNYFINYRSMTDPDYYRTIVITVKFEWDKYRAECLKILTERSNNPDYTSSIFYIPRCIVIGIFIWPCH